MARSSSTLWRICSVIVAVVLAKFALITAALAGADIALINSQFDDYSGYYDPPDPSPSDYPVQVACVVLGVVTILVGLAAAVLLLLQIIPIVVAIVSAIFALFWFIFWIYCAQDLGRSGFGDRLSSCHSNYSSGSSVCTQYYLIVAFVVFSVLTDLSLLALAIVSFIVAQKKKQGLFNNNNSNLNNNNVAYTGPAYGGFNQQPTSQQYNPPKQPSPFPAQSGPFQPPPQQQLWAQTPQQSQSPPTPNMQQQPIYQPQPQYFAASTPPPQQNQNPQVYIGSQSQYSNQPPIPGPYTAGFQNTPPPQQFR